MLSRSVSSKKRKNGPLNVSLKLVELSQVARDLTHHSDMKYYSLIQKYMRIEPGAENGCSFSQSSSEPDALFQTSSFGWREI